MYSMFSIILALLPAIFLFVPTTVQAFATMSSILRSPLLSSLPGRSSYLVKKRCVSSSPYGRTHVWKRRPNKLPNPVVPHFPQRVVRSDGSTFVHWTTSPRSLIKLTRDVTNNPVWNPGMWKSDGAEEESEVTGRLGRFNRRFEGLGGIGQDVDWMGEEVGVNSKPEKS